MRPPAMVEVGPGDVALTDPDTPGRSSWRGPAGDGASHSGIGFGCHRSASECCPRRRLSGGVRRVGDGGSILQLAVGVRDGHRSSGDQDFKLGCAVRRPSEAERESARRAGPTRGDFTTCLAMSGHGAGIGTTPRSTAPTRRSAGGPGTTIIGVAGRRCGAAGLVSRLLTWAFG